MTRVLHRTANWWLGAAVWLSAAFVFPLHLGLAGAPFTGLLAYGVLASALLLTADVLQDPECYRREGALRAQAGPFLLAVAGPAALAFAVGHAVAPLEEAMEEEVCQLGGLSAARDGSMEEIGDGFDMTADCAPAAGG